MALSDEGTPLAYDEVLDRLAEWKGKDVSALLLITAHPVATLRGTLGPLKMSDVDEGEGNRPVAMYSLGSAWLAIDSSDFVAAEEWPSFEGRQMVRMALSRGDGGVALQIECPPVLSLGDHEAGVEGDDA